jgi:AraC-like DNA-binding protein
MEDIRVSVTVRLLNMTVAIWKARKFIEEHSGEELSLSKVAKAVSISANHLSERFKQVTGVNFVDYIALTRFEKACALLRNSNRRISEIAFAVSVAVLTEAGLSCYSGTHGNNTDDSGAAKFMER